MEQPARRSNEISPAVLRRLTNSISAMDRDVTPDSASVLWLRPDSKVAATLFFERDPRDRKAKLVSWTSEKKPPSNEIAFATMKAQQAMDDKHDEENQIEPF